MFRFKETSALVNIFAACTKQLFKSDEQYKTVSELEWAI